MNNGDLLHKEKLQTFPKAVNCVNYQLRYQQMIQTDKLQPGFQIIVSLNETMKHEWLDKSHKKSVGSFYNFSGVSKAIKQNG